MSPINAKDQSTLLNKLILVVLVAILGCLVVLIVRQNNFLAEQEQLAKNPVGHPPSPTLGEAPANQPSLVANRRPVVSPPTATARAQPTALVPINDQAPLEPMFLEKTPQFPIPVVEAAIVSPRPVQQGLKIAGVVRLRGTPPPEIPIQMDSICGRLHTNVVTTRHFVVSTEGGLANVFVYVKSGLRSERFEPPEVTRVLDQRGCLFEPYVLGVMTGQKFQIRNSDPFMHNVHALAKINDEFNLGQPTQGQVNEKVFDKPEVFVQFKCDAHPWMFAYLGVVEHPYFAVTDSDGNFRLPLPIHTAGAYVLAARHPKAGELIQSITVDGTEQPPISFTFQLKSY